jgi:mRNA-degrading endonuclease toxin of MazEF toxin-antitoxin module
MSIRQGDVFEFDFGPQKSHQIEGPHPAVIIQTDHLNVLDAYGLVLIVPLSSSGKEKSPSHIRIEPDEANGLANASFAKCEQIFTVPKRALKDQRGSLTQSDLYRVKQALKAVLAIG